MRLVLHIGLTALLAYMVQRWLPAWSVVVCAGVVAMGIASTYVHAFFGGFTGIGLVWMTVSAVIDVRTHSILSAKIAPLLGLPNPMLLVLLTGFIGGVLGGLGAVSGYQLRRLLRSNGFP
ncbi:MAG: hypothetical protein AAF706_03225 [Bacteroidota bacterium]